MDEGFSLSELEGAVPPDALLDALLTRLLNDDRAAGAPLDRGSEPLFALANELAELFGGSVAIEDLGRRIVAYSAVAGQVIDDLRTQGILTRRVPDSPLNDDQYRTVLRANEPVLYPRTDDEEARIAYPIRAGGLPLGSIWAIDGSGEARITPEQRTRLRAAAELAASYMLEDLRLGHAAQQPREHRLLALLDGAGVTGSGVTGSELAELGISEERGGVLLAFATTHDAPPSVLAQLRSSVHRHLALHRPETVTAARAGRVYALVERESTRSPAELIEPLLPVIGRLLGDGVRVALPGIAHRPAEVAPLRTLADRLFAVDPARSDARADPHPRSDPSKGAAGRLLTVEALRPELVFERVSALFQEAPELRSPELERMRIEDPSVTETLAVWCGCFGNVARTARELGIHENTVRYRLGRAREHYGVALEDPDELLVVWLQLRSAHGSRVNPDS
ncbi:PucR family transcriptional regulator [Leucobacter tenebrionis]|uniref:PucR family transcriptional regulator n=1 Tax=Leucobacter tenebrionis TaxID=2873270 RepID=UPI001CA737A3|nr:helix-turn-helix domain-containing protein [Leucobacter tenebrionis]QZY53219.1 helix-turn-helix domain-containing protein [Leucobacter tenebrionis]